MPTPKLLFLHLSKTGGMSLRRALAAHYPEHEIMPVPHNPHTTTDAVGYPTTDGNLWRATLNFEPRDYRLIMGHYDWSVVDKAPGFKVLTVLRDPVARFWSLYRYICQEQRLYGMLSEDARSLGAYDFALHHTNLYANAMTLMLAGVRYSENWQPVADDATYAQALHHLQHADFVGTTEGLGELTAHVFSACGFGTPTLYRENVTRYTYPEDPRTDARVREFTQWDQKLYEWAARQCHPITAF